MAIEYRLARKTDSDQLAEMRWGLYASDAAVSTKADFLSRYTEYLDSTFDNPDILHWVAAQDGRIVSNATLILVHMPPWPGQTLSHWGYVTNCYTVPSHRRQGIGADLLEKVKNWSKEKRLELLTVWPSETAYGFYERAGFQRHIDPLTLLLQE